MSTETPLESQIESLASQAKDVTVDGQRVIRRSLSELIEADKYLSARAASRSSGNGGLGIKFVKLIPPAGG